MVGRPKPGINSRGYGSQCSDTTQGSPGPLYYIGEGVNKFDARLLSYGGASASSPPMQVTLELQGRHCIGSIEDVALLDDIYHAAKEELRKKR